MLRNKGLQILINSLVILVFFFLAIATQYPQQQKSITMDISLVNISGTNYLKVVNQGDYNFEMITVSIDGYKWVTGATISLNVGQVMQIPLTEFLKDGAPITSTGSNRTVLFHGERLEYYGDFSCEILF